MSQQIAASTPLLIQVSITERPPAIMLSKLADQFSYLFISIQKVLTPPIKINKTKGEIIEYLRSGVPLQDIADGIGSTDTELRQMLESTAGDENHEEM